ncbi:uncharacterized protein LOC113312597 [Papaver somniferum]|uniref:uncharacterized protein LOC113312597 n=1 Tax=Papaver somniferum TaxID=3469 RepID=UPI000E700FAD|nr:uncharacterized protein LOC113312597 [Papaver somniferum]
MVVAEFKFFNQAVSHPVSGSTTVKEILSVVKHKWPYVPEDLILFGYTVDGISNVINHNLDLRFFIHYCSSQGIDLLKFEIKLRTCVGSISSSSSSAPASSSSSSCISSDEVVVVEDITDDACLIKKVPKKYDAWVNILTGVGQLFEGGIAEVKDSVKKYEICSGRNYKLVKSDLERYTVECKFKNDEKCRWRFHASLLANSNGIFQCKRYIAEHSCSLASSNPSKVRMKKSFMKNILSDDLRASKKKKTAYDVIDLLQMEYGVDLTYSQAYHSLQFTKKFLWGDNIKSYSDFVWYKYAIKQYNPGSVVNFEYDSVTRRFKRFFIDFEAPITGFNNYCRPMLFIDCTFLTGKFKGGLMVACGKTGNQEIYLVVFGIVPCESCESWQWFLTNLKGIIREDRPLTIISDPGIGLLKHVPEVFPDVFHSYCSYYMKGNIHVPKGRSRQTAVKLFEECNTSLIKEKFYVAAKTMSNLKLDSVLAWMMKIQFDNWAAHAFIGERWGENTSNIAESFNNVIKHDKSLPALELVDVIRAKIMEQNYKRLLESNKWTTRLNPHMQERFNKRITDCRSYKFQRSSEKVFEIISPIGKHTVNLDSRTCSCKWWQKHSFPCTHAMKAMLQIGNDEPYNYISPYYTSDYYRRLYSRPIYLIPDSEKPPGINEKGYVFPPNGVREQGGSPKGVRYMSSHEKVRKKRKCGQCGILTFHNRRTCHRSPLAPRAPTFRKVSHSRMVNFLKKMLF